MRAPFQFAVPGGTVTGWSAGTDGPDGPAGTDGPDDAVGTVVLVHGANGHAGEWEPLADVLSAAVPGTRVVAVDLPAHGDSSAAAFDLDACRDAVLAAMDGLDIVRAHLVGSSFGGLVVLALAAGHPGRVRTVTTAGTSAGGDVAMADAIAAAIAAYGVREFYAETIPQFSYPAGTPTEVLEAAIERASAPGPEVATQIARAAFGTDAAVIPAPLAVPVLVLGGADDQTCPPERVAQLAERFGAEPTIVPGLGHLPHLEDPARLAGLLRTFWTVPGRRSHAADSTGQEDA